MVAPQKTKSDRPVLAVIVPWLNDPRLERICTAAAHLVSSGEVELIISVDGDAGHQQRALLDHCLAVMDPHGRARVVESSINAGPGAARNLGLSITTARYVTFADADDIPDLEEMILVAQHMMKRDLQVVAGGFEIYNGSQVNRRHSARAGASLRAELVDLAGVWRFVYSTELLQDHHCEFESVRYGEDILFLLQVAEYEPRYAAWPEVIYRYTDSESSSRLSRSPASTSDLRTVKSHLWEHLRSESLGHRALSGYWLTRIATRQRALSVLRDPLNQSPLQRVQGLITLFAESSRAHGQRRRSRRLDRQERTNTLPRGGEMS